MKKQIALLLVLLILLAGCSGQPSTDLPAHDYPLSKELVEAAIKTCGLPGDLTVEVNDLLETAKAAAHSLGVGTGIDPFMTLSFMALPVIPTVRLTTRGVVDVITQQYI